MVDPDEPGPGYRQEIIAEARPAATIGTVSDTATLNEQLEEIGAQLAWVRDYL